MVGIVLGLAALVAITSRAAHVWAPPRVGPMDRTALLANVLLVGGAGLVVALAVTLLAHRSLRADRPSAPPFRTTLRRAVPILSVLLAALTLFTIARTGMDGEAGASAAAQVGATGAGQPSTGTITDRRIGTLAGEDRRSEGEGEGEGRRSPVVDPRLLYLLAAIAAVVLGSVAWSTLARHPNTAGGDGAAEKNKAEPDAGAFHEALVATIDAMLADPDPNTAIIGAYARLLEGLAESGVGRREHEGPLEHLQRALAILRVRAEPVHQLGALFEIARFSSHRLTATHRDQALAALREAAQDLASAGVAGASAGVPAAPRPPVGAWR